MYSQKTTEQAFYQVTVKPLYDKEFRTERRFLVLFKNLLVRLHCDLLRDCLCENYFTVINTGWEQENLSLFKVQARGSSVQKLQHSAAYATQHKDSIGQLSGRCHFRDTSLTINEFFSTIKIKEKRKFVCNHPASNPELLFPNIPLLPLHYQADPPSLRKFNCKTWLS